SSKHNVFRQVPGGGYEPKKGHGVSHALLVFLPNLFIRNRTKHGQEAGKFYKGQVKALEAANFCHFSAKWRTGSHNHSNQIQSKYLKTNILYLLLVILDET